MSKYCADCSNLDLKEQKIAGIYKCKKNKEYVTTCNYACEKFEENYSKTWYEKQKLYDEGKKISTNDTPTSFYVVLLIIITSLYIVCRLLGY